MTQLKEKLAARWQDAANLVLGLWLAASPWALDFVNHEPAARNAWAVGAFVALAALAALLAYHSWEEWVNAALGTWLVLSPYLLNYASQQQVATWNQFFVGLLVFILAVWAGVRRNERLAA